jgi:hypothetical protein
MLEAIGGMKLANRSGRQKPIGPSAALERDQLPPDALVRRDHAGEWVAWDSDLTRAVATGADMEAVRAAAVEAGVVRPVMEWVPPTPVRPIGPT